MQLLKRIELWVLLAAVIAGLFFVFGSRHPDRDSSTDGGITTVAEDAPLKLHRCILTRDYGNAQLEIELKVRNDSPEKLVLAPPAVKLISAKGREVPGFFLPFQPQPEIPAKTTEDVQLRYWLDKADLEGALKLDVKGKTLELKGPRPFDLLSMKNTDKKSFNPGEW
jgi:hypothetical protein